MRNHEATFNWTGKGIHLTIQNKHRKEEIIRMCLGDRPGEAIESIDRMIDVLGKYKRHLARTIDVKERR